MENKISVIVVGCLLLLNPVIVVAKTEKKAKSPRNNQIETIEVVAQKRVENIQTVPIAISAISPADIETIGYKQLNELVEFVPNMRMSVTNDFTSIISLRGVGAASRSIGFDSRVGLYLDGVYLGQSPANNQDIYDLERVEVLRGPQGTLFGKNNVAGAIQLISKKPENEFFAKVGLGVGNYGLSQYNAIINTPLGDDYAAKFSVNGYQRDGTIENIVTGHWINEQDNQSYRGQLIGNITNKLSFHFSFDNLTSDRLSFDGEAVTDTLGRALNTEVSAKKQVSLTIDPREKRKLSGQILTLDWQLDNGYLFRSISGHRETNIQYQNDFDYSVQEHAVFDYEDDYAQLSQEIQIISPVGKFQYIAGFYYYQQDAFTNRRTTVQADAIELFTGVSRAAIEYGASLGDPSSLQLLAGFYPGELSTNGTVDTQSYAAFLNTSYHFNNEFSLDLGFRYSEEEKQVDWQISSIEKGTGIPIIPALALATGEVKDKDTYHDFSPLMSLNYQINDNIHSYFKFATGYKSGGFNVDFLTQAQLAAGVAFDKETVKTYELGIKGLALARSLTYRAALFSSKYDDFQVNQLIKLAGGTTALSVRNAAKVDTKGLELELNYQYNQFDFFGVLALLDATFDEFKNGGLNGEDLSGGSLPEVSDYSYNVGMKYFYPLPALNSELVFNINYHYRDDYNSDLDGTTEVSLANGNILPVGHVNGYGITNMSLIYLPNSESYKISLWAKNITDQDNLVLSAKKSFFGARRNTYVEPKTYGVMAEYFF
ncbi:MAG: TonB-dependent receptor [Thalassotalea sp.]